MTVSLRALASLEGVTQLIGDESVMVSGVCSDSRRVEPGDLFAALRGRSFDGATYVAQATERGAQAVLSERPLSCGVPVLQVDDVRRRLGAIAHHVYGAPTEALRTVGVTGTNGKTTVTHLLESVLLHAGKRPALLGTVALRGPQGEEGAELTTPEADRLASFAARSRAAGATHLVLEVSSVALREERVRGMRFEVAAFTNLSHDHLDYHGTFEAYGAEKERLFTEYAPATSVVVVDHAFGAALAAQLSGRLLRCSVQGGSAEIQARVFESTREGIRAEVQTPAGTLALTSPLFGAHNMENLLVTIGCALALGIDLPLIGEALRTARGAPGRMERVHDPRGVLVLVDYAHSPDALARALAALRPLTAGRLFVLFGCGGDRDRQKRPAMAEAAATLADLTILTSDNPRSEPPEAILAEMEPAAAKHQPRVAPDALSGVDRGYALLADRRSAIAAALAGARAGDTVLLAGKGHENYQIVGATRQPFDDRLEAAAAIATLGSC